MNKVIITFLMSTFFISLNGMESNPICINRSLDISTSFQQEDKKIYLTINESVQKFEIIMVHGIDGLDVYSYEISEISPNESYLIEVDYDDPDGQSFLLISTSFEKNVIEGGLPKREVISIPIGEISNEQRLSLIHI